LRKSFSKLKVVEGFSLQVAAGEICVFLGTNGSGKTTTIRMLCGLLKPDSGRAQCLGYNIIRQPNEIRRQVNYMTRRFSLHEDLTVFQNLDFVAHAHEMAASSGEVPRPASRIRSMQAEDVGDYVVPLFLREREHRHPCVRGGESHQ
jgi:ABC-type multidrug transport system ATPase subunit